MKKALLPSHHVHNHHPSHHHGVVHAGSSRCNRTMAIILTFIACWIGGSIIIFSLLTHQEDIRQSSHLLQFVQNTAHRFSSQLLHHRMATLMPKRLPATTTSSTHERNKHSFRRDMKKFHIFFDWTEEDTPLSMIQLKAFESALHTYPHATFALLEYPMGDSYQLSVDKLHLYTDLDYDIISYSPMTSILSSATAATHNNFTSTTMLKKMDLYVTKYIKRRLLGSRPAFHIRMFARLLALHAHGGIYSDFSFFFLSSFVSSSIHQSGGFYLNSYCLHRSSQNELWQVFRPQTFDSWELTNCFTSTLLFVSQAKSPAIECILENYNQEMFHVCLDSDAFFGGADCVKHVMEHCFDTHNIANLFDPDSSVKHNHKGHHQSSKTHEGNGIVTGPITKNKIILESFEGDPMLARQRLIADANWTILAAARVVWLALLSMDIPLMENSNYAFSMKDSSKVLSMAVITDEIPKDSTLNENALNVTKEMGIAVDIAPKKLDIANTEPLVAIQDSLLMHLLERLSNDSRHNVDVYNSIVNNHPAISSVGNEHNTLRFNLSIFGFCSAEKLIPYPANASHNCLVDVTMQDPVLPVIPPAAMVSACPFCGGEEIAAMLHRYESQQNHRRFLHTVQQRKSYIWVTHSCYHAPVSQYERSLLNGVNTHSKIEHMANWFPIAPTVTRIPLRAYANRSSLITNARYATPRNLLVIDVNEELTKDPLVPSLFHANIRNFETVSKPMTLIMRHPAERWRQFFLHSSMKRQHSEKEVWSLLVVDKTSSSRSLHLLKVFRSRSISILKKLLTFNDNIHSQHDEEMTRAIQELVQAYFHLRLVLIKERNSNSSGTSIDETLFPSSSQISVQPQLMESLLDSIYFPSIFLHLEDSIGNKSHSMQHQTKQLLFINSDLFSFFQRGTNFSSDSNRLVHNKQKESLCYILKGTIFSATQDSDSCSCDPTPSLLAKCPTWDASYSSIKYPSSDKKRSDANGVGALPLILPDLDPGRVGLNMHRANDMSRSLYKSLVQFFRPFNVLLHAIVSRCLVQRHHAYDEDSKRSMQLFLNTTQHWVAPFLCNVTYSMLTRVPLVNVTQDCLLHARSLVWERLPISYDTHVLERQELWFEEEDLKLEEALLQRHLELTGALNKKENLLHHLLPQRESKEDSGFNTTLGMLNTF